MAPTRPPLFRGRITEREDLDRLFATVAHGRSQVLVIRGEAGVGKSALMGYATTSSWALYELAEAASRNGRTDIAGAALTGCGNAPAPAARPGPWERAHERGRSSSMGMPPRAFIRRR